MASQTMVLEYGFGSTFASVSSWSDPGGSFNFTSLQNGATATALDGTAAANRTAGLGGTINTAWTNGSTLWIAGSKPTTPATTTEWQSTISISRPAQAIL